MENDEAALPHDVSHVTKTGISLTRRRWRVGLSILTVTIVLMSLWVIFTHINTRQSPHLTLTAQPPHSVGAWTTIALPAPKSQIASVLASPVDPATIFACVGSVPTNTTGDASDQFRLWRTGDSGAHWMTIDTPTLNGYGCAISIADSASKRILVMVRDSNSSQPPCTGIRLYLSNDDGATWQQHSFNAATPAQSNEVYCDVTVTAHHLYSEYSYSINADDRAQWHQVIRFVRSDDEGATWQAADTDLGTSSEFHPYQLSDENSFVAAVWPSPVGGDAPMLWVTHDAGRHWSMLARSGGDTFILTPTGDNALPSSTLPWYALTGEQADYVTIYQTTDLKKWTKLPRLPVPGSAPNIAEVLTVLSDGEVVALGVIPQNTVTPTPSSQENPARMLDVWIWNPQTARWRVINAPFDEASGCGLCPGHFTTNVKNTTSSQSDTYIWIYDSDASDDVVYQMRLPH